MAVIWNIETQMYVCRSLRHFIPKPNGHKPWIHSLCPFGKDLLREVFAESRREPQGWSHGGYAKRRRERAILQQCALRTKLRKARITHLGRSHDVKNAFASTDQGETIAKSIENLPPESAPFVRQRILEAATSMRTLEGFVTVAHGAGALQGDSVAGEMFSST